MKSDLSNAEFNASLADRLLNKAATPSPMHMNPLPSGSSKSVADLLEANQEGPAPAAEKVAAALQKPADEGVEEDIPLNEIVDSPSQPRRKYDETELQQLATTLKERGQDEPITVRRLPSGKYELIAGHRRVRAARLLGWTHLKGRIRVLTDRQARLATMVHNETNIKLSDYERGMSYRIALEEEYAATQVEVARLFGCTQGRVSQCLSLFDLPKPLLDLLVDYPDLINSKKAKVIRDVLAAHPAGTDAIVRAAEVLIDKPDMEPAELRAALLKPFERKRVRSKAPEVKTIQDKNGESAYRVQIKSNDIVISVEEGVDIDLTLRRAMAALREMASTIEVPKKEKREKSKT